MLDETEETPFLFSGASKAVYLFPRDDTGTDRVFHTLGPEGLPTEASDKVPGGEALLLSEAMQALELTADACRQPGGCQRTWQKPLREAAGEEDWWLAGPEWLQELLES
jgi:hypothetical protein